MATTYATIISQARNHINETTASFWSDAELLAIAQKGTIDLWRSFVDLKQEYFLTIDTANVTMAADTATLTGTPAGVYKVYLIEPLNNTSAGPNQNVHFTPLDYNDPAFRAARATSNVDPSNTNIYYAVTGQGAPYAAPTVHVAPKITSAMSIRFVYVPVLSTSDMESADSVPLPGEVDNAIIAWTVAYARAKERDDVSPDPGWIAIYGTEKTNLMNSLGVRNLQEPEFAKALFEDYWG